MIIRQFARRQGRSAFRARIPCTRAWPRSYASEAGSIGSVDKSSNYSNLESDSIGASLQSSSSGPISGFPGQGVQQLEPEVQRVAQRHQFLKHQSETSGDYGAVVGKYYKPSAVLKNPPCPSALTPELLLASQTHLGHSTSLWNPMNSRYIYGHRDGIHIISLEETLAHLRRACRVVKGVAERGGLILFVGTRRGQDKSVVRASQLASGYHLFEKWIPGSITNGNQILGGCKKKIVDMNDKEIAINEDSLREVPALKPDLVVVLNPLENWVLLNECALHHIPTIGIIDTDADPTCVTYPVPANDDSLRCTDLIACVLGRAGQEGQASRKALAAEGKVLYEQLKLPDNTILGDAYKTELKTDDVPVEYVDSDGRPMTKEEIEASQRQGELVDKSMLTIYNDNDDGDPQSEEVYHINKETGHLVPELTKAGGGGPGAFDPRDPSIYLSSDEGSLTKREASAEEAEELERRVDQLTRELSLEAGLGEEAGIQAESQLETLSKDLEDELIAKPSEETPDAERFNEELAKMEEKDLIDAAKPKPDDGLQAKLDQEKKGKSH